MCIRDSLRGAAGGHCTRPLSQDVVGMSQAVWPYSLPTCFVFGADLEDVSSDSLVSALLRGAAGGDFTRPLSRDVVGMSQA
eukprot:6623698-Pyramimonas_sp.AAC.1